MTRAVILAAGDGGRLGEHTAQTPKPLVSLEGRRIIDFTLDALAAGGVKDALLVVGYRADQIVEALAEAPTSVKLTFVENDRFHGGASLSLRAARAAVGNEPFLLLMADHLLSLPIISRLLSAPRSERMSLIATDASPWPETYIGEATRVALAPGTSTVAAIGKGLEPWDGLDTGAFLLAPSVWEAVDAVNEDCELSLIFSVLAARGELEAVDVSGAAWYDVDTAEDLAAARRMVAGGAR